MTEAKKDVSVSVSYTENSVTVSGTYQISIAYIYNKFSCSPNYTWGQYTINSNGSYSYTVTNNLVTYHYSDFVGFGLSNAYLSSFNTSSGYFTTLVSDSIVSSSDLSYINTKDNVFYGNDYDEFNVFNASSGYKRYKLVSHDPSTQTIKGYFIEVTQEQTMGNYIKDISSTTRTEYPDNGIQSSYWYKYNGTSNVVNKAAGSSKLNSYSQLTTGYCISDSGNYYYYESV
jgi:hypothetical protein